MNRSKETDLVLAVLLYAIRSQAEGDMAALQEMGFGKTELEALEGVELAALHRAGTLRAHCLTVMLNREVFLPMLQRFRTLQKTEMLKRKLLAEDASLDMMDRFFGMSRRDYARWRRILGVIGTGGRPPDPDEEQTFRLWKAIQEKLAERERKDLLPGDFLDLKEETGLSIRAIWRLAKDWEKQGREGLPVPSKDKPRGR